MNWQILTGDCVEQMRQMDEASVDAIVTDPPAGIAFMSKAWDGNKGGRDQWVAWLAEVLREGWRVAKPGAHALVWALPRTSHWTGWAIEEAGWEIRDRIAHHFGSGFPKSHNLDGGLGTALKPATEDWWLARKPLVGTVAANVLEHGTGALNIDGCRIGTDENLSGGAYAENATERDDMWATQRPGDENVMRRGREHVGEYEQPSGRWPANVALSHLPECEQVGTRRVKSNSPARYIEHGAEAELYGDGLGKREPGDKRPGFADPDGTEQVAAWRCVEGCPVAALDEQSGERGGFGKASGPSLTGESESVARGKFNGVADTPFYGDSGGASRFFYCAKASRGERGAGLDGGNDGALSAASGNPPTPSTSTSARKAGSSTAAADRATSPESSATNSGARCASCGGVVQGALRNSHPT